MKKRDDEQLERAKRALAKLSLQSGVEFSLAVYDPATNRTTFASSTGLQNLFGPQLLGANVIAAAYTAGEAQASATQFLLDQGHLPATADALAEAGVLNQLLPALVDWLIYDRKNRLAYKEAPDAAAVQELAPWWPPLSEVPYRPTAELSRRQQAALFAAMARNAWPQLRPLLERHSQVSHRLELSSSQWVHILRTAEALTEPGAVLAWAGAGGGAGAVMMSTPCPLPAPSCRRPGGLWQWREAGGACGHGGHHQSSHCQPPCPQRALPRRARQRRAAVECHGGAARAVQRIQPSSCAPDAV
jgi:hypothetical protein